MIENRGFALGYRVGAFLVALSGLVCGSGITKGLKRFLFYTGQSNALVCVLFFVLSIATLVGLVKHGVRGSACCFPRLCCACALTVSYTLVIFWCALAPFVSRGSLLGYGNIVVHTASPLLCIFDCIFLQKRGRVKRRDIALWPLIPLFYVVFSYCFSLSGTVFYTRNGVDYHYPYYFMDFDLFGFYSLIFLSAIALSFVLFSALIYRLDNRRAFEK